MNLLAASSPSNDSTSKEHQEWWYCSDDDNDSSSVRTDLTTVPSSNVQRVTADQQQRSHASRPGVAGPFDILLNEMPEQEDRGAIAAIIYTVVGMFTLRPGYIERQFNVFVPNYNGNSNIHNLGQQIENFYHEPATHTDTVALIGSRSRELAAAAASFRVPPLAIDDCPTQHWLE